MIVIMILMLWVKDFDGTQSSQHSILLSMDYNYYVYEGPSAVFRVHLQCVKTRHQESTCQPRRTMQTGSRCMQERLAVRTGGGMAPAVHSRHDRTQVGDVTERGGISIRMGWWKRDEYPRHQDE